jgi:hypothetical protein
MGYHWSKSNSRIPQEKRFTHGYCRLVPCAFSVNSVRTLWLESGFLPALTGINSECFVLSRYSIGGFCLGNADEDVVNKEARIQLVLGGTTGCGSAGSFSGSLMTIRASSLVGGLCSIIVIMMAHGPG